MAQSRNRPAMPISGNGDQNMSDQATVKKESADVWASAPDAPLIPFLTADQRAALVNSRDVLKVTGMEYRKEGLYGPNFNATFIGPDGNAYHYSFTTSGGGTPRDQINKWIWETINKKKESPIPVVLCKRGRSYYFDKPGSESEMDYAGEAAVPGQADSGASGDTPDF